MKISRELLKNWLLDNGYTESIEVYTIPVPESLTSDVPEAWRDLLEGRIELLDFIEIYWGASGAFPETKKAMCNKLQEIGLVRNKDPKKYELLYVFYLNDTMSLYSGGEPTSFSKEEYGKICDDLNTLYNIHSSFLDPCDGITGYSVDNLDVLSEKNESDEETRFLKVFEVGSNYMGFDLLDTDSGAYILWSSEEEVEKVDSFLEEVDEWLAEQLEEFNDRD